MSMSLPNPSNDVNVSISLPNTPKDKAKLELKCPVRFFKMTRGDMDAANMWWNKTLQFRTETQPEQWLSE